MPTPNPHPRNSLTGVLLLFVDGVGVGARNPNINPFARLEGTLLGRFQDEAAGELPMGGFWKPIDASLGVPGLPQSATGQATILTGVNVPRRVGQHISAIPDRRVRLILEESNLFSTLSRQGKPATFANAYTPGFFTRKRPHISVSTRSMMSAGLEFRRIEDLVAGRAVYHDYTNRFLIDHTARRLLFRPKPDRDGAAPAPRRFPEIPPGVALRGAGEAANILLTLASQHAFTLHEHFLTDLAGHRGTEAERDEAAARIEALIAAVAARADEFGVLTLVVSDHGNLEDGTVTSHTANPVPLLAWGPGAERAVSSVDDLTHVAPAILASLA